MPAVRAGRGAWRRPPSGLDPDVEPDIDRRRRLGQLAGGDEPDPRFSDRAHRLERDATRSLHWNAAVRPPYRPAHFEIVRARVGTERVRMCRSRWSTYP